MFCSSHIFVFCYFGHFTCVIFFTVLSRLSHLALQNVNKDYFCNFIAKSDQKPKTKNGMNKRWMSENLRSNFSWLQFFQTNNFFFSSYMYPALASKIGQIKNKRTILCWLGAVWHYKEPSFFIWHILAAKAELL